MNSNKSESSASSEAPSLMMLFLLAGALILQNICQKMIVEMQTDTVVRNVICSGVQRL